MLCWLVIYLLAKSRLPAPMAVMLSVGNAQKRAASGDGEKT